MTIGKLNFFFKFIYELWQISFDRFADNINRETTKLHPIYYSSGTTQADDFSVYWRGENNYVISPIHLIF